MLNTEGEQTTYTYFDSRLKDIIKHLETEGPTFTFFQKALVMAGLVMRHPDDIITLKKLGILPQFTNHDLNSANLTFSPNRQAVSNEPYTFLQFALPKYFDLYEKSSGFQGAYVSSASGNTIIAAHSSNANRIEKIKVHSWTGSPVSKSRLLNPNNEDLVFPDSEDLAHLNNGTFQWATIGEGAQQQSKHPECWHIYNLTAFMFEHWGERLVFPWDKENLIPGIFQRDTLTALYPYPNLEEQATS